MKVSEAIQKAFLHAQRKATAPAAGTSKYEALLDMADSFQLMWASEPNTEWGSLYDYVDIGTASATDLYDLDDTIKSISKRQGDYVRVGTTRYNVVNPNQLYEYREQDAVAKIGSVLRFSKPFESTSPLIGESIIVPAFLNVSSITSANQTIQVDDPMWLVFMMAAEFVRNDAVKSNQYDNLIALANQIMENMKQNNSGQLETVSMNWRPAGESWV